MLKNTMKRRAFNFGFTEGDVRRYREAMTSAGWTANAKYWLHESGFTMPEVEAWHHFIDTGQTPAPAGQMVLPI
jgi:hypothetical protein